MIEYQSSSGNWHEGKDEYIGLAVEYIKKCAWHENHLDVTEEMVRKMLAEGKQVTMEWCGNAQAIRCGDFAKRKREEQEERYAKMKKEIHEDKIRNPGKYRKDRFLGYGEDCEDD